VAGLVAGRRLAPRARPGASYLAGAPLLIAHRGGSALAPENTLVAFRQAIEWWRADILEIDVSRIGHAHVGHAHVADVRDPHIAQAFLELQVRDAHVRQVHVRQLHVRDADS
jgi:hypothetical protein